MRRPLLAAGLAVLLFVQAPVAHAEELLLSRFADYLESLRIQARIPGLARSEERL